VISGKVFYGGANSTMLNETEEDNNTNKQCNCDSCIECNCDPEVCRCNCHTDKTLVRDFE
jgi:hypothetical protein